MYNVTRFYLQENIILDRCLLYPIFILDLVRQYLDICHNNSTQISSE